MTVVTPLTHHGSVTSMRIDLLSANEARSATSAPLPRLISMWRVGTIMEATAIRDATTGQLWLQVANQQLPARLASGHSTGPLNGEQLKLRVLRDTPVLALESIDETRTDHTLEEALRRYLPRQTAATPLLANLGWLARNPEQLQKLPHAVQQILTMLWKGLPNAAELTDPLELKQALLRSGVFLESRLLQQQTIDQDFKAGLLALRQQLSKLQLQPSSANQPPGPMPSMQAPLTAMAMGPATLSMLEGGAAQLSELRQQAEGSLARTQTNQLLNAQAAQQGMYSWLVELPIKRDGRAELLRFKFEREQKRQAGSEEPWIVEVALDIGTLGALHIQIKLSGMRLNVQLRSESAPLVTALNQQLDTLKEALGEHGLQLDRIVCLHGQPVDTSTRLTRLLDLHA
ncbi:MAG: flagellar hook-length control protein FliK [Steroidobacteraceae bacterium]